MLKLAQRRKFSQPRPRIVGDLAEVELKDGVIRCAEAEDTESRYNHYHPITAIGCAKPRQQHDFRVESQDNGNQ